MKLRFNAEVTAMEKVTAGQFAMTLFLDDKHVIDEIMVDLACAPDFWIGRNLRLELVQPEPESSEVIYTAQPV